MTESERDFHIRLHAAIIACGNPFGPNDDAYKPADFTASAAEYEAIIRASIETSEAHGG